MMLSHFNPNIIHYQFLSLSAVPMKKIEFNKNCVVSFAIVKDGCEIKTFHCKF